MEKNEIKKVSDSISDLVDELNKRIAKKSGNPNLGVKAIHIADHNGTPMHANVCFVDAAGVTHC